MHETQKRRDGGRTMTRKKVILLANAMIFGCFLFYTVTTYYLHSNHKEHSIHLQESMLESIQPRSVTKINWNLNKKNVTENPPRKKKNETEIDTHQNQTGDVNTKHKHEITKMKKFWRYDDAGPKVIRAETHYLSSIPQQYRLGLPQSEEDFVTDKEVEKFFDTVQNTYASNPDNVSPKKIHLYEMNPSITKLPEHYRRNEDWRRVFGKDRLPYYAASYRITHLHNCYDNATTLKLFGDSWKNRGTITTDYLGISVMDENLNILVDATLDMNQTAPDVFADYGDYRLFNLGEQLFLSTWMEIAPIDLSLSGMGPNISGSFEEIPKAFPLDNSTSLEFNTNASTLSLSVWARNFSSCAMGSCKWLPYKAKRKKQKKVRAKEKKPRFVRSRGKNFLYFGRNHTNATDTTTVIMYLKKNPSQARSVDLTKPCSRKRTDEGQILGPYNETSGPIQPRPAFETIEAKKYPNRNNLFASDRGSACCTSVKAKSIFPLSLYNMKVEHATIGEVEMGIDGEEELLVAIVHPKTMFPGKSLPEGVSPNTYLSKFVAFLPKEPYTIVAKSGMFCLGYPNRSVDGKTKSENPLEFLQMNRLRFANETYECPRIHFVTGMVDAPPTTTAPEKDESGSVIIAYGVSDCLSRFIEVPKSEIIRMLTPGAL